VPDELDNRLEIELLKKDVVTMSALLSKFDTALDKMQEIASSLSRMVSLQEQRIEVQETATKELQSVLEMRRIENNQEIKELHSRITTVNRELTDNIDSINKDLTKKISDTEKTILAEIQALRTEIKGDTKGIGARLSQIELWKYGVGMVIVVIAFIVAKAIDIAKLF
jgi:protein subunit release factor A